MIKATTSIKGMYALTKEAIIKLKMPISITNDVQCDKKGMSLIIIYLKIIIITPV